MMHEMTSYCSMASIFKFLQAKLEQRNAIINWPTAKLQLLCLCTCFTQRHKLDLTCPFSVSCENKQTNKMKERKKGASICFVVSVFVHTHTQRFIKLASLNPVYWLWRAWPMRREGGKVSKKTFLRLHHHRAVSQSVERVREAIGFSLSLSLCRHVLWFRCNTIPYRRRRKSGFFSSYKHRIFRLEFTPTARAHLKKKWLSNWTLATAQFEWWCLMFHTRTFT